MLRTAQFDEHPCVCVTKHVPAVAYTHRHHIWPLFMGGAEIEQNIVYICPTTHDQVHKAIRAFVKAGKIIPLRMNRYAYDLAVEGYERKQNEV